MSTPPASKSNVLLIVGIILGLLFPIGGLIVAIILFVRGSKTHGFYVLGATVVGVLLALAFVL